MLALGLIGYSSQQQLRSYLVRRDRDALADDVDELADGEVHRDEILPLVHRRDVRARVLLADDRDAVGVLRPNAPRLRRALLLRVLRPECGRHRLPFSVFVLFQFYEAAFLAWGRASSCFFTDSRQFPAAT